MSTAPPSAHYQLIITWLWSWQNCTEKSTFKILKIKKIYPFQNVKTRSLILYYCTLNWPFETPRIRFLIQNPGQSAFNVSCWMTTFHDQIFSLVFLSLRRIYPKIFMFPNLFCSVHLKEPHFKSFFCFFSIHITWLRCVSHGRLCQPIRNAVFPSLVSDAVECWQDETPYFALSSSWLRNGITRIHY